jgi:hypothetical protein
MITFTTNREEKVKTDNFSLFFDDRQSKAKSGANMETWK